jgi:hypothetical protein
VNESEAGLCADETTESCEGVSVVVVVVVVVTSCGWPATSEAVSGVDIAAVESSVCKDDAAFARAAAEIDSGMRCTAITASAADV